MALRLKWDRPTDSTINTHSQYPNQQIHCHSPCTWHSGRRRGTSNVRRISGLVQTNANTTRQFVWCGSNLFLYIHKAKFYSLLLERGIKHMSSYRKDDLNSNPTANTMQRISTTTLFFFFFFAFLHCCPLVVSISSVFQLGMHSVRRNLKIPIEYFHRLRGFVSPEIRFSQFVGAVYPVSGCPIRCVCVWGGGFVVEWRDG